MRRPSMAAGRLGMPIIRCASRKWNAPMGLPARSLSDMISAMFPQHIIARKRDGHALTRDEIAAFVRGATDGSWADYQLSALLMAIFLRGLSPGETAALTEEMMRSGTVANLSALPA